VRVFVHPRAWRRSSIAIVRGLWLVGLTACGANLGGGETVDGTPVDSDAPIDTAIALGPWSAPAPIDDFTPVADDDPSPTGDLLEMYFNRSNEIFVTTRARVTDPWGPPVLVPELSDAAATDTTPEVTYDGLTIYLASNRGGLATLDIFVATRASRGATWGTPALVPELSSGSREAATATSNNTVMVFESDRGGDNDTFLTTRASAGVPWGTPARVDAIATTSSDGNPMLSADGLELYFSSNRTGDNELYLSTRATVGDAFGPPVAITELAGIGFDDQDPWISPDRRTLLFTSNRDGTTRLWQSTR